jgi:predicted Zn-dependent protease
VRILRASTPNLAILLLVAATAGAHMPPSERIAVISRQLGKQPDAGLHLERARLHADAGHWSPAFRDCDAAERLNPGLAEVDLCRSGIALDHGDPEGAARFARRFLQTKETAGGYRALASALAASGHSHDAATAMQRAIERAEPPRPGDFLQLARWRADDPARALAALDEGVTTLGSLVVLQSEAVRIHASRGQWDEALARLDDIVAGVERPERWLAERADLLAAAGRAPESWVAASRALAAIGDLSPHQRETPAVRDLDARLRALLARPVEAPR